jgi:hypothetical protein
MLAKPELDASILHPRSLRAQRPCRRQEKGGMGVWTMLLNSIGASKSPPLAFIRLATEIYRETTECIHIPPWGDYLVVLQLAPVAPLSLVHRLVYFRIEGVPDFIGS